MSLTYNTPMLYLKTFACMLLLLCSFGFADIVEEEDAATTAEMPSATPGLSSVHPKAEEFYAQDVITGRYHALSEYNGQVVLLFFWATYDRYCIKNLTVLNKLQEKYKKKGLVVLGISVDKEDALKEYLEKNSKDSKFQHLWGSPRLAKQYNVWGLPTIYILGRDLTIRKTFSGYMNKKTIEKELRKLL